MTSADPADRIEAGAPAGSAAGPGRYVRNRSALLAGGECDLRRRVLDIAEEAIASADPGRAVRAHLRRDGDWLLVGERRFRLSADRRVFVIGAGKATFPIAAAIEEILGAHIAKGLVICKAGQEGRLDRIEIRMASHPIPDQRSLEAARRTVRLLEEVRASDIVLSCFTGGSSALFVEPADGISLQDKAETSRILLHSGANIIEINAVRKHISKVKGGRLAKALPAGTTLINLTVSDVIGDALDYITDPTVPDSSNFAAARGTLDRYRLWDRLPASVTDHLRRAEEAAATCTEADLAHLDRVDVLLLRADAACLGAAEAARRHGFRPLILSTSFEGESSHLARTFAAIARQVLEDGNPVARPCALIGGGETTVTIDAAHGEGGPNQEFAMRAAIDLDGMPGVVALGMDTDGTDGPTGYAGGLADGTSAAAMRRLGFDPLGSLADHDVTRALAASGHIIETGATGTNVNDLKILLVG